MSGRKRSAALTLDGDVEVAVIRSSDGKKSKASSTRGALPTARNDITISLSSNLNDLKDRINADPALGPAKRSEQRLFHLGRELKTGSRSLEALGIGNFNVFSIHLHSLAPQTVDLQSDDEGAETSGKQRKVGKRKSDVPVDEDDDVIELDGGSGARSNCGSVIDLAGESAAPLGGEGRRNGNSNSQRQLRGEEKVVELLDSDSDDDVVEIVEPTAQRQRMN
ncbi:hypothetical protein ACHAXT_005378 [Thalassiosira profunda]